MPEEINRILTDRISDILFCPTITAVNNLMKEGYDNLDCKIARTGDVMQDAALFFAKKAVKPEFDIPKKFVLATIHRAENTDDLDRLNPVFEALNEIGKDMPVLLPLHPRTKKIIRNNNIKIDNNNIFIVEAVGYLEMIYLLQKCQIVMTDSGGLQKEAYFFKKYCLTLRDETEWVELVENGFNLLVAADKSKIIDGFKIAKKTKPDFSKQLYGGGKAANEIVKILKNQS
jgi:UDP-GlcNAc3NAcA epimerase